MPTTTLTANKSVYVTRYLSDHTSAVVALESSTGRLLVGFPIPETLKNVRITKIEATLLIGSNTPSGQATETSDWISLRAVQGEWNENDITYANRPTESSTKTEFGVRQGTSPRWESEIPLPLDLDILRYGMALRYAGGEGCKVYTTHNPSSLGNASPQITVTYSTALNITVDNCTPASGFIDEKKANTFRWNIRSNYETLEPLKQTSATFRWRTSSTAVATTAIISGDVKEYTIPANTITSESIEWQVTVNTAGASTTSSWFTVSTVDSIPQGLPLSPVSIAIDGLSPTTFRWAHLIDTSTEPTGYTIQTSTDGVAWSTLHSSTAHNVTEYTAPAEIFATGELYWRVRTRNTDNVWGDYSAGAMVIVVSTPLQPVITIVENSPRPTISWQTDTQQAYEIRIGEYDSKTIFGTAHTWKCPFYLNDGQHIVQVRAQSDFGLWSRWGTADFTVTNIAGSPIVLVGSVNNGASLEWSTEGTYDFFIVQKDGKDLIKTTETHYADADAEGTHTYGVRGCNAGAGDYGMSNAVELTDNTTVPLIKLAESDEWLSLELSDMQLRSYVQNMTNEVIYHNMAGYDFPIAETSNHKTNSVSVSVSFVNEQDRVELEAMSGKKVVLKTPHNGVVVGVLDGLQAVSNNFYTTYNFTIQQLHTEVVIDLDA